MKRLVNFLTLAICVCCPVLAQESEMNSTVKAKEVYDDYQKFRFGGYGEMAASYLDYDWNWTTANGTAKRNRGEISIPRFILAGKSNGKKKMGNMKQKLKRAVK